MINTLLRPSTARRRDDWKGLAWKRVAPEPALRRAPPQPPVALALQTLPGDARCNQAYSAVRAPPRSPPAFPLAGGAICARLALALAGGGPGGVGRAGGGLWPQPGAAAGEERGARREEAGPCGAAAGGGGRRGPGPRAALPDPPGRLPRALPGPAARPAGRDAPCGPASPRPAGP